MGRERIKTLEGKGEIWMARIDNRGRIRIPKPLQEYLKTTYGNYVQVSKPKDGSSTLILTAVTPQVI